MTRKQREYEEWEEEILSRRNGYGYDDPTAYEVIRAIMMEEQQKKRAAHGPNGRGRQI